MFLIILFFSIDLFKYQSGKTIFFQVANILFDVFYFVDFFRPIYTELVR